MVARHPFANGVHAFTGRSALHDARAGTHYSYYSCEINSGDRMEEEKVGAKNSEFVSV